MARWTCLAQKGRFQCLTLPAPIQALPTRISNPTGEKETQAKGARRGGTWQRRVALPQPAHKLLEDHEGAGRPRQVEAEGGGGVPIALHTQHHLPGARARRQTRFLLEAGGKAGGWAGGGRCGLSRAVGELWASQGSRASQSGA